MEQKLKGSYAEYKAVCWLLENGYEVYKNVSYHGVADLIVEKDGEIIKIDVKSVFPGPTIVNEKIKEKVQILLVNSDGFELIKLPPKKEENRICKYCNKEFKTFSYSTKTICSPKCAVMNR